MQPDSSGTPPPPGAEAGRLRWALCSSPEPEKRVQFLALGTVLLGTLRPFSARVSQVSRAEARPGGGRVPPESKELRPASVVSRERVGFGARLAGLGRHALGARQQRPVPRKRSAPPSLSPGGPARPGSPGLGEREAESSPSAEKSGGGCFKGTIGGGGAGFSAPPLGHPPVAPPRRRTVSDPGPGLEGGGGRGGRGRAAEAPPPARREGRGPGARPLFLSRVPPSAAPALAPYLERRHP